MNITGLGAVTTVALLALLPATAQAFCGTYVGQPGDELYSGASRVVMVRQGDRTTLTMANDIEASVKDFAMVLPVPQVLSEDDVRVLDASLVERIREYAGPRVVQYQCSDFVWEGGGDYGGSGCSGFGCSESAFSSVDFDSAGGLPEQALDVTVEAEFAAGEFDIVILSSEDSADLMTWLTQEGYGVDPATETMLGEYIDSGAFFMAAKVRLDDVPTSGGLEGRPYLSPLQISYDSSAFSLPIRLGTMNSPGSQDLLLFTVTDAQEGAVGIANYPETTIESDCLWDEDGHGGIETFLDDRMNDNVAGNAGVAWVQTYGWGPAKCDPCPPGGPVDDDIIQGFGFEGTAQDAYLTRLWMRYDADAVDADVTLYASGDGSTQQLRYIVRDDGLQAYFPVCSGWEIPEDEVESCEDILAEQGDDTQEASIAPWWLGLGALSIITGLGVWFRRRREG